MWTWHIMFFRNLNMVRRCEQMWNGFTCTLLNQCDRMSPRPPLSGLSNEISAPPQIFTFAIKIWCDLTIAGINVITPAPLFHKYSYTHTSWMASWHHFCTETNFIPTAANHQTQSSPPASLSDFPWSCPAAKNLSCLWDQSAVLTTLLYLQSSLPPTVFSPGRHTQTDLVWKEEVLKAGLDQMTQWRREAPCERGDKL